MSIVGSKGYGKGTYNENIWNDQEVQFSNELALLWRVVILKPLNMIPFVRFDRRRHLG
jgi:hypothetical protein